MTAALFILAASCIVVAGLLLYVAIRHNGLIDENSSLRGTVRKLSIENESLKEKNLREHVAMNRLARKCKQRGRTIQTLERKIGILKEKFSDSNYDYNTMLDENAQLHEEIDALKTEKGKLAIENGKLKVRNDELEGEVKDMQTHYNTLYERKEELEKQIKEADKKLLETSGQYETKIAKLKREIEGLNSREICPYEHMGRNRIVYCMKEKEKK